MQELRRSYSKEQWQVIEASIWALRCDFVRIVGGQKTKKCTKGIPSIGWRVVCLIKCFFNRKFHNNLKAFCRQVEIDYHKRKLWKEYYKHNSTLIVLISVLIFTGTFDGCFKQDDFPYP